MIDTMSMICTIRRLSDSELDAFEYAPEVIADELEREVPTDEQVYLDKAWDGLHFLLSADIDEYSLLGFLLHGGHELGDPESGSPPVRVIMSLDVEALDEELATVTEEQLRAKFDPARMLAADIYPAIWDRDPAEDDTLGWLLGYFKPLQQLVSAAAKNQQGLLIWIS